MKHLLATLLLTVSLSVMAEDKNTHPEHPTAQYKMEGVDIIEFTPKGNSDYRCIVAKHGTWTANKNPSIATACYPVGKERD